MEPMKLHINWNQDQVMLRDSNNNQYMIEKRLQPIMQAIEEHRGRTKTIEIVFNRYVDEMRSSIESRKYEISTFCQRHCLVANLMTYFRVPVITEDRSIRFALVGSATEKYRNWAVRWFPSHAVYPHAVEFKHVKYGHVTLAAESVEEHLEVKCGIVNNDPAGPMNRLNSKFNQNKTHKLLSWCDLVIVFGKNDRKYRKLTTKPIIQFN